MDKGAGVAAEIHDYSGFKKKKQKQRKNGFVLGDAPEMDHDTYNKYKSRFLMKSVVET